MLIFKFFLALHTKFPGILTEAILRNFCTATDFVNWLERERVRIETEGMIVSYLFAMLFNTFLARQNLRGTSIKKAITIVDSDDEDIGQEECDSEKQERALRDNIQAVVAKLNVDNIKVSTKVQ